MCAACREVFCLIYFASAAHQDGLHCHWCHLYCGCWLILVLWLDNLFLPPIQSPESSSTWPQSLQNIVRKMTKGEMVTFSNPVCVFTGTHIFAFIFLMRGRLEKKRVVIALLQWSQNDVACMGSARKLNGRVKPWNMHFNGVTLPKINIWQMRDSLVSNHNLVNGFPVTFLFLADLSFCLLVIFLNRKDLWRKKQNSRHLSCGCILCAEFLEWNASLESSGNLFIFSPTLCIDVCWGTE